MKFFLVKIFFFVSIIFGFASSKEDSLISITKNGNDIEKCNAFLELSDIYTGTDLDLLKQTLDSAYFYLNLIEKDPNKLALYHFNYAYVYYYNGDSYGALEQYYKARDEYRSVKNNNKLALTLNNIGVVCNDLGQYDKAINNYKEALYIYEILERRNKIALVSNNIGIVYMSWGNYNKALDYYKVAQENYSLGNDSTGMAAVAMNIANVYSDLNYLEKAEEKYLSAITILKKLNNRRGIASAYNNLGELYSIENNNKSIDYFLKASEIFLKENFLKGLTISYLNIGNEYRIKKLYSKAEEYFEKAKTILQKTKDIEEQSNYYFNLALLLSDKNQVSQAETYFLKGLNLAEDNKYKRRVIDYYENLFLFYKKHNKLQKAIKFNEKYYALKDSLNDISIHQQVSELQNSIRRIENEKKIEQQNLLLKNNELKLRQEAIIIYSLSGGSALLLFLLIFLFISNRKKKKINEILHEQNSIILDQKEELEIKFEQSENSNTQSNLGAIAANETDTGILILNSNFEVVWKNLGFDKVTQYSIDNIKHASLRDIFPNDDQILLNLKQSLESKKPVRSAIKYNTSQNNSIWLQITINPVLDDKSNSYQLVLFASDITTHKVINDSIQNSEGNSEINIQPPPLIQRPIDDNTFSKVENLELSDGVNQKIFNLLKKDNFKTRILVNKGPAIVPIKVNSISYFYTENKVVWVMLESKTKYATNYTLEELQKILNPQKFFRINRQFIISINCITKIITFSKNKLQLEISPATSEKIYISRAKISEFKKWLSETI